MRAGLLGNLWGRNGPNRRGGGSDVFVTSASEFDAVDWAKPNQKTYLQRDLVLRNKKIPTLGTNSLLSAFGTGNLPVLINSTEIGPNWTNVSGNIWAAPLATAPYNLFERTSYAKEGIAKLTQNTLTPMMPTSGQWGHTLGTIYVFSAADPNTKNYENVGLSGTSPIEVNASGCIIENLALLCSDRNAILFGDGVNGGIVRYCDVVGATNDGVDGAIAANLPKNILIEHNNIWDIGYGGMGGGNASGDGISFHGNGAGTDYFSVIVRNNDFRRCTKGGVTNQSQGETTIYGNSFTDCFNSVWVLGSPTDGNLSSDHNFYKIYYNRGTQGTGLNRGISTTGSSVINSPIRVEIYNNTLVGASTVGQAGIFIGDSSYLTYNIRNNIVDSYMNAMSDTYNTSNIEALDYNCLSNFTNAYFDGGTGNLAAKVGGHSLTTNPLMIGGGDYTLQLNSPCINAGVDVGLTTDRTGAPVVGTPDIGAYELNYSAATDADINALVGAMTTPPTTGRKTLIDNFVYSLKVSGAWYELDCLWMLAAADSQAGYLNWKKPAANNLAPVASPTFTADRGVAGNGSTSYINSNFNPGDGGTYKFTRNNACYGVWNLTSTAAAATTDVGGYISSGTRLRSFNTGGVVGGTLNAVSNASSTNTVSDATGHTAVRRNVSTTIDIFKNGASLDSGISSSSATLPNIGIYLCGHNVNGTLTNASSRQIAACHYGAYLNDTQMASLYNGMRMYLQELGAV